jgi:sporulation protein YabP
MAYDKDFRTPEPMQNVIIEGRRRAAVSGVTDVESFDENEIIMTTTNGTLFIKGVDLRVGKLSLDTGDVTIEGEISRVEYEDDVRQTGGLFSKLFK